MTFRLLALTAALTAPAFAAVAVPVPSPALLSATLPDSLPGSSSQFTVSGKTQIPGKTLSPGSYTIRIVDHLSDRMIVEVSRDGKPQATFLALPASHLPKPGGPGPISLNGSKGGQEALRGFAFPNGVLAEFVYPKAEAVSIAKSNSTTIPAVDPASEGIPEAKNLSPKDMQTVTLWLLTPTVVGPDSLPAVSAARYRAPQPAAQQQVAAAPVPPPPPVRVPSPAQPRVHVPATAQPTQQVASLRVPPRPVRSQPQALRNTVALPHTASDAPLVGLTGVLAGMAAALLATRRRLKARA